MSEHNERETQLIEANVLLLYGARTMGSIERAEWILRVGQYLHKCGIYERWEPSSPPPQRGAP